MSSSLVVAVVVLDLMPCPMVGVVALAVTVRL
jgi:hypothetical protein